ncbi:uncharacterized protein [Ptychodera flava]|uniref:uncharacterized protein n=1 Tax=Ptychodera flava TaxID=63121 RepID=UPI00396A9F37
MPANKTHSLIVIGGESAGSSGLMRRYTFNKCSRHSHSTEEDRSLHIVQRSERRFQLKADNTTSMVEFRGLRKFWITRFKLFMVWFTVDNIKSLEVAIETCMAIKRLKGNRHYNIIFGW